jgi:hypothetical protein
MASPTKIGFYLNYAWDEPTRTACAIADTLTSLGVSVTMLSSSPRRDDVHAYWDERVYSEHRIKFDEWANRCSHLIWLDVPPPEKLQSQRRQNVLLFPWHRITAEQVKQLQGYRAILCPSKASFSLLQKLGHSTAIDLSLFDVFEPMLEPKHTGQRRLFCPIDSYTARAAGLGLLHSLQVLLDADMELHVTIGYGRNWSAEGIKALEGMSLRHGDRLTLLKRPTWLTRCEAYLTHDLVCDFSLRQTTGLFALEALAHGRPVLAFDVAPMQEIVQEGETGWRVPCGIAYNSINAPEVVVNHADLLDRLKTAIDAVAAKQLAPAKFWKTQRRQRRDRFSGSLKVALDLI